MRQPVAGDAGCPTEPATEPAAIGAGRLTEWRATHASSMKPKTLMGYRHDIEHYVVPRIGRMRLQALRPAVISQLYRDLAEHGGRDGRPLSALTVAHIHRTFAQGPRRRHRGRAVAGHQPGGTIQTPRHHGAGPGRVWTTEQLDHFLAVARTHRLAAPLLPAGC
jgi:integrase